ncbi:MAG: PulJ/GspJ family protein [Actinomycetota bacterium]
MSRNEDGFTMIEMLVTMFILSVVTTAFFQLLMAVTRGSKTSRSVVEVSEEARMGLNRIVRDTRESNDLTNVSATSFTVASDYDGDGTIEAQPSESYGNYETLTFTFNEAADGNGTITASNGVDSEVMMRGVDCIRKTDGTCHDIFSFASSRLEYNTSSANDIGVTTAAELDDAPGVGNNNNIVDGQELDFIDSVRVALTIRMGESDENFYAEAQLRNNR